MCLCCGWRRRGYQWATAGVPQSKPSTCCYHNWQAGPWTWTNSVFLTEVETVDSAHSQTLLVSSALHLSDYNSCPSLYFVVEFPAVMCTLAKRHQFLSLCFSSRILSHCCALWNQLCVFTLPGLPAPGEQLASSNLVISNPLWQAPITARRTACLPHYLQTMSVQLGVHVVRT